jgi:hypothetical protein
MKVLNSGILKSATGTQKVLSRQTKPFVSEYILLGLDAFQTGRRGKQYYRFPKRKQR